MTYWIGDAVEFRTVRGPGQGVIIGKYEPTPFSSEDCFAVELPGGHPEMVIESEMVRKLPLGLSKSVAHG